MITTEQLYAGTRDGLDIILSVYPQAEVCVNNPKAKFKARETERTPSATLIASTDKKGNRVWKVVDYGDEGHALSPVDIWMKERGVNRFSEAVLQIADLFNIRSEINKTINRAEWDERPAKADEAEGQTVFELMEEIPEPWLKVLGPKVTRKVAESLHWHAAKYVGYVKNRVVKCEYSNDNYPILLRECIVPAQGDEKGRTFYKIYKPLNPDKAFRFSYAPRGEKPRYYINGLEELRKQWRELNERLEREWNSDPTNENIPYKETKIAEAIICSGERDALCCKAMGYAPLWFNSETYRVSDAEFREITKYAETIYNIPDLDATGKKKGCEMALRFIDVKTVWLPEWLTTYKDNRGRPRKDLRDWMELRGEIADFKDLLMMATPAKFWREKINEKKNKAEYWIDTVSLLAFLELNGYHCLKDEDSDLTRYVHITGTTVREIKQKDIRRFIRLWAEERALNVDIRNLILNSTKLAGSAVLENLSEVDLDFSNSTADSQIFYLKKNDLQNVAVEITAEGLKEHTDGAAFGHYVWEENVIPHRFTKLEDMFEITSSIDETGTRVWDIDVKNTSSPMFGYIINTSRIHWRKEIEERFATSKERAAYHEAHKFDIAGEGLSDTEIQEQKLNLVNKIFSIGYMLHRHKDPSRAWAPQAMDNKIGSDGECNGRSGKSFLFKAFEHFMKQIKLSGRNPKLMDNPHVFDQVDKSTDFILVDDCAQYLSMGIFYDIITGALTVNPKNNRSFTIPFHKAPKMGFTTNYVPTDFDASTMARLLPMVFSDYYHERALENDYLENRSIRDDFFGRSLLTEGYPESDWNRDINFFMQCCRFYLSVVEKVDKILPPLGNILQRKFKADMGENFEDWALTYFAEESGNLDCLIVRSLAFENYTRFAGNLGNRYTMKRFTKQLKSFVTLSEEIYMMNPPELCNSQGRISRRVDGKLVDVIYLRSKRAQEAREPVNDSFNPPYISQF